MMLAIQSLSVMVDGKSVLNNCDLSIQPGSIHVLMGPNGSGKSTLGHVLVGKPGYEVTSGQMMFMGESMEGASVEERAARGLFMTFQHPVEIPGVTNIYFLRTSVNQMRRARGLKEYDAMDFMSVVREQLKLLGMDESLLYRSVNEGFSGGEKKRNEILQMLLTEPSLVILDEIDSGLDIDGLQLVGKTLRAFCRPDRSLLIITHNTKILEYLSVDKIHILFRGRLVASGGPELVDLIHEHGYDYFNTQVVS